jgi:hypothetical protein
MAARTRIRVDPVLDAPDPLDLLDPSSLDPTYLKCRSYGHAWDEFNPIDLDAPVYGWRLSLRCLRCHTERHDNLDYKGMLMARRYIYADGYSIKHAPERPVFREALFVSLRAKLEKTHQVGSDLPVPAKKTRKKASTQA